jgi:hypothetical protein
MNTVELDGYIVRVSSIDAVGAIYQDCEYYTFYVFVQGRYMTFSDIDENLVINQRNQLLIEMGELH